MADSGGDIMLIEDHGPVRVLTLNRPSVLNAVSPQLGEALRAALAGLDADPGVQAGIITGGDHRAPHRLEDVPLIGCGGPVSLEGDEPPVAGDRHLRRRQRPFVYFELDPVEEQPEPARIDANALGRCQLNGDR
jgi:hypothetical protein